MRRTVHSAPTVLRVSVRGVRLYESGGEVGLETDHPISAFVGANGIGKSTLLALINFGITGIVPKSSATYASVDEFVDKSTGFATDYFTGRVSETDRLDAEVSVQYKLGSALFSVTRGLFENRLVRSFDITLGDGTEVTSDDDDSSSDTATKYQDFATAHSGLANFNQFVFWQIFMLTFDERRHLLFWDEKTLQSALLISLGQAPKDATKAESLRRNMERLDSNARNARWRATQATNKRNRIAKQMASGSELNGDEMFALIESHDRHIDVEEKARAVFETKEVELRDTARMVAELAVTESTIEKTYLTAFESSGQHKSPAQHPAILQLLEGFGCELCGTKNASLGSAAASALQDHQCPLCESDVRPESKGDGRLEALINLDHDLAGARDAVLQARARYKRVREEVDQLATAWRQASDNLDGFLRVNANRLKRKAGSASADEVRRLDREIAVAMTEVSEHREAREALRIELEPIIENLVSGYKEIETRFVPTFRRLAESFIGRSVDVEFERRGTNVGLRFSLDGQSRRSPSELSESQQFFLDIALRMSLIETFIPDRSTMLVDTPEGSLDIAYETRAGMLFDRFSRAGNNLILMSNLNASNLLLKLAEVSSPVEMRIFRMIEWSKLSEVQLESAELFEEAYDRLDAALGSGVELSS